MKALEVSLKRDSTVILNKMSLEFEKGLHLVAGPNGSGKSSLLKILAGLYRPSTGKVILNDLDITRKKPNERLKLGITLAPDMMKVALSLTVDENLEFCEKDLAYSIFPGLKKISKVKGKYLSGGERQMVVLARAFATKSNYFLLDEPFQGLHPNLRKDVLKVLEERMKKSCLIVATHDEMEEILNISKKVHVLVSGSLIFSGEKEEGKKIVEKMFF